MILFVYALYNHGVLDVWCPGCDTKHSVDSTKYNIMMPADGTSYKITVTPSIATAHGRERCHAFITNGLWEFMEDSTHELAGQVVDMVQFPIHYY